MNKWIASQIGSREHFAIPKALKSQTQLHKFYTDIWVSPDDKFFSFYRRVNKALINRYDSEIDKITESLGNESSIIKQIIGRNSDVYEFYCNYGEYFSRRINKKLEKQLSSFTNYFTYNTGALESFQILKKEGKFLVLGQIDPGRVEREIVKAENEKFPDWATDQYHKAPDFYFDRIQSEWELADRIVVNSKWSKNALITQGVESDKISIIPLSYEAPKDLGINKTLNNGKLKVLFAANVILRKGIQYLIESAKQLQDYDIQFIVAGPINISSHIIQECTKNIKFLGKIERHLLYKNYLESDVFVLPTLSDGFAITQIEAMSYGLPVITTDRCGEVVTNEEDGLLINSGSADELSEAILKCYYDREFLYSSSLRALEKSKTFSHHNLSLKLTSL